MKHLTDTQIGEAAEGEQESAPLSHLAACALCARRVGELRAALREAASVPVPDPSPLFWEHFPARVSLAIDTAPTRERRWWSPGSLAWLGAAAVIMISVVGFYATQTAVDPGAGPRVAVKATMVSPSADAEVSNADQASPDGVDGPESDEAWALMQSLAVDLHYDDVRAAGVMPRPGSIESVATELSEHERAELVRLIQYELKRMGA